jgi:outer membrane biosynthesis protein TonB
VKPGIFAAGLDWLEGLLPLLFVGFWILSQVMAVFRRVRGDRPGPVVVREPGPQPAPPEELQRQIEEFLREVGMREPQPKPSPPPPPAPPRLREQPPQPRPQPAVRAAVAPPVKSRERRQTDVARHVHDAFAHELSHLESSLARETIEPQQPPATNSVAQVAAILRSPQTIRQALLLREVLERPVDRW